MKKRFFVIFIILLLTVSLIACDNGSVGKQSISQLDLNFKSATNKTVDSKLDINLSYFAASFSNAAPTKTSMNQHAELNRVFTDNAFFMSGKVYSGTIDSSFRNLINTFLGVLANQSPEMVKMVKDYLFKGHFLSFEVGMKDGVVNAKGDYTEKGGVPDFKYPSGESSFSSLFYGLLESDIYKFLNDMELPIDLDINLKNILNFNDPFAMDWSNIKDNGSKRYNSKEDAYLHKYNISGDTVKNLLLKTLDESVAEAVKNDESLLQFQTYYNKYKSVVLNWFKFSDVVLNAKSDKNGNLIEKNISYNLDFTLNIPDLNLFIEDFPEMKEIIGYLPLLQLYFASSDGNKDKITFLVSMNYNEKYSFSSQLDLNKDIFSGSGNLADRFFLEYVEYVDKDGNKAWKWQIRELPKKVV